VGGEGTDKRRARRDARVAEAAGLSAEAVSVRFNNAAGLFCRPTATNIIIITSVFSGFIVHGATRLPRCRLGHHQTNSTAVSMTTLAAAHHCA